MMTTVLWWCTDASCEACPQTRDHSACDDLYADCIQTRCMLVVTVDPFVYITPELAPPMYVIVRL